MSLQCTLVSGIPPAGFGAVLQPQCALEYEVVSCCISSSLHSETRNTEVTNKQVTDPLAPALSRRLDSMCLRHFPPPWCGVYCGIALPNLIGHLGS